MNYLWSITILVYVLLLALILFRPSRLNEKKKEDNLELHTNQFPKVSLVLDGKLLVTYLSLDCSKYITVIFGDTGTHLGPVSKTKEIINYGVGGTESGIRQHISIWCLIKQHNEIPSFMKLEDGDGDA